MLRSPCFTAVAAAILGLISASSEAPAGDGGVQSGELQGAFEYFYGWPAHFDGLFRVHRPPFAPSARPVGVGVPFLNDDYPFYSEYPPTTECVLERRPISNVYGLGWRNFIICYK